MNALRKALADYFAVRRALGFKLYRSEKLLNQFLTFVEDRGEDHLTTETALAWATLPQRGQTWAYARLSVVRRFANHLRGIDPATEVPPTHLLVQQKGRATPYLYSAADIWISCAIRVDAGISRNRQGWRKHHPLSSPSPYALLLRHRGLRLAAATWRFVAGPRRLDHVRSTGRLAAALSAHARGSTDSRPFRTHP